MSQAGATVLIVVAVILFGLLAAIYRYLVHRRRPPYDRRTPRRSIDDRGKTPL